MAYIEKRISPNGKISFRAQIRLKGFPPQTASFQRRTDAKKWAQVTETAIREGRHFKTAEAKKHTLADMIDRYLRDVMPTKSRHAQINQGAHLRWWRKHIGDTLLADVTPTLIAEYRDKIAQGDDQPRSNATVVRYMAALSHAFTIAIREWGWLEESPMRKVAKPKEPRGRVRFLSDDERERLLEACRTSYNPYLYPAVVLALSTGTRQMESMGLYWKDIDFQRQTITLHDTKNGERRTLPLTGHALELIQQHFDRRRMDSDFVFPSRNGKKPFDLRRSWVAALKTADITDFHWHDLRHSTASYLAMNGATLAEIAEILGHKTLSMVKRYAHLSDVHTASVVARMNEKIFGNGTQ
jgi:integrase